MTNQYEHEIQKKIFNLIIRNPGIYLHKIAELTGLSVPIIEHHTQILEEINEIKGVDEAGYKKYYATKREQGIQYRRTGDIRNQIYTLINENPGLHLSRIAEILNIRVSLADYHLRYMEKAKMIYSIRDENNYLKYYYISDTGVNKQERMLISLLRQKIPMKIVIYLLIHRSAKYNELQQHLNISAQLLSYHLNKLVHANIISTPTLTSKGYSLVDEPTIIAFLKKYRFHLIMEKFLDVWDGFQITHKGKLNDDNDR
ncbi:MAG: hypothetical protein QXL17_04375 [Candidatus Thermoplasmatota archaeon]